MQENDRQFNDKLYDHLCEKDEVGFWKAWRKRFCVNKLLPTNTLNGKTGINNVLFEFTEYYKDVAKPHNAATETAIAVEVDELLTVRTIQENVSYHTPVTVSMLEKCISNLKRNKATCFDNISSEHLLHAGPHINVHLSLLFNSMIHHCFVPSEFCMSIIHPLLKN